MNVLVLQSQCLCMNVCTPEVIKGLGSQKAWRTCNCIIRTTSVDEKSCHGAQYYDNTHVEVTLKLIDNQGFNKKNSQVGEKTKK